MLTARAMEHDKISGLEAGDDYLTKPSPKELAARIKAVFAGARRSSGDAVEAEGLRLDPATRRVSAHASASSFRPPSSACCTSS